MDLIKSKLLAARKIYEIYWDSYMQGDLEAFAFTIDEDFEMIGTSESEVAHNKSEGISFYKAQMEEVVGKVEMRNRKISAKSVNELVLILEECDIYVHGKLDLPADRQNWTFYSKTRISTLLHETETGWKVIQQHGSLPDIRVQAGETLALEKISKENLELRDAVKRRTAELENKNRELAIESSLEKVRAVAMGMKKPENMLDVCHAISDQLQVFGVEKIRNVQIAIIDENIGQYLCYQYFTPYDKTAVEITEYPKSPVEHGMVKQMLASRDGYFIGGLSGRELEEFRSHRKEENHFPDPFLDKATELDYCFLSIGEGGLGLTLYQPMAEETLSLFKRFHQVFSLAYQRFRDIQKAEALAREAQVEAALERVRAQTMAMHSSEDVGKCVVKMFSELTALGVNEGTRFGIGILNHENENNQLWTARKTGDEVNMHIGTIDMAWHPMLKKARQAWLEQVPFHQYVLEGEDLLNYYQMLNNAPDYKIQIPIEKLPKKEIQHCFIFEHGFFYAFTPREFQPELIQITKRFSTLFEQTYRRYLDLVKAEAQAREAEIELALERVRARTMAMQHSDELTEASEVLDRQVRELGIETWGCAFHIYADDPAGDYEWFSSREGSLPFYKTPRENFFLKFYEKGKAGETFHVKEFLGEDCKDHYDYLMTIPILGDSLRELVASGASLPESQYDHIAFFKHGFLLFITYKPVPESHGIFQRFSKVFEQTYTRFLDLQKAEAQAREAQIEAGLERVRARSMAMHRTEELQEAAEVLNNELNRLRLRNINQCGFAIYDEEKNNQVLWLTKPDGSSREEFTLPAKGETILEKRYAAWKRKDPLFHQKVTQRQFEKHLKIVFPHLKSTVAQDIAQKEMPENPHFYCANFRDGYLHIVADEPLDREQEQIMIRFTKVFSQTYTRFLDLQKAEAQAREAQIEASLERVRANAMGLRKSDELENIIIVIFEELQKLGLSLYECSIFLRNGNSREFSVWGKSNSTNDEFLTNYQFHFVDHPFLNAVLQDLDLNLPYREFSMDQGEIKSYADLIFALPAFKDSSSEYKESFYSLTEVYGAQALFQHGFLEAVGTEALPGDLPEVLKRFSQVIDLTYTRFLDLQKAENQAREAQIEAALERIRSRAVAMQSSDELKDVAMEIRTQMGLLGQRDLEVCAIHLYEEHENDFESWGALQIEGRENLVLSQSLFPKSGKLIIDEMMDRYGSDQDEYVLLNAGKKAEEWFDLLKQNAPETYSYITKSIGNLPVAEMRAYWAIADFSGGSLVMVSYSFPDSDSRSLLRRTANVFGLAYKRFKDLRMAEISAKAAMRQASLDRVRADISSMRHTNDLDRITPLIFKELTILGVPFIRCGIFIIQEKQKIVEAYLSSPEGNSLGVLRLPYKASELTYQTVEAWRKGEILRQHWNKEDFIQWINQLMKEDQIQDGSTYQGTAAPPESLDLHFVPFTQGMLYVGAVNPLEENELELVQALAKAFSIAYARYEDFVKLEQAKAEVESAIIELKATQSQLIQQEKLASLGQLTAGIAHEIKNPLNFVNNFSELSSELIDEAFEELEKIEDSDPKEETLAILKDVRENLIKVHEHGTRANGIVTSMLQHSRGGSGKMEPTDLNTLIKEYVNLSYHGMRAGKNPIDVDIILELDPEIKEVSLIKEDFTRVIINLCNNAFDACAERSRSACAERSRSAMKSKVDLTGFKNLSGLEVYHPKLTVRTKFETGSILIQIEDNGPGIPDEIKDKILQPFFTTKKGTEGTGLGLSITHDIVKAHRGELKVESEEGKRTEFTINLPIS